MASLPADYAEKARAMERIKRDLSILDSNELRAVRPYIDNSQNFLQAEVDLINEILAGFGLTELEVTRAFTRQLQNQRSPFFKLSFELRDRIFDMVVLDNFQSIPSRAMRERIPPKGELGFGYLKLVNLCQLQFVCRQFRAECKDVLGRLTRLGMVLEFQGLSKRHKFEPDQELMLYRKERVIRWFDFDFDGDELTNEREVVCRSCGSGVFYLASQVRDPPYQHGDTDPDWDPYYLGIKGLAWPSGEGERTCHGLQAAEPMTQNQSGEGHKTDKQRSELCRSCSEKGIVSSD